MFDGVIVSTHSMNEQGDQHMINDKNQQEGQRRSMDAERKELQQATRHFIRSVFRTGMSFALLPITILLRQPQQHFQVAGRKFTHGCVTLVGALADGLEKTVKDANTST